MEAASHDLFCPTCGYNLRGIESDRCPECGREIDRSTLAVSKIPWVHRQEIGGVRAYFKTLVMATFRPRRIGEEAVRPVNYRDAQRFRWTTVAVVYLPLLVMAVALYASFGPT